MEKLAIIGSGISGLACAHFLQKHYDLTMFEADDRIGGHSHTVSLEEDGKEIRIDTGFMVFNHVTYPNLIRLFAELGVTEKKTDMSFSVMDRRLGLEFCGSSVNHLFAQRKNLLSPRFWRMLMQIKRFNEEAIDALKDPALETESLGDYVKRRQYGDDFFNLYLVPMSSAVWSTPPDKMLEFPAASLIRFFHNHGFLGLTTQHQWYTLEGGVRTYVDKLIVPFQDRIQTACPVTKVKLLESGKVRVSSDGGEAVYDKVIFACHGHQALALIDRPDPDEQRLLDCFQYQPNLATLHTDESVMPKTRLAWSAWNYCLQADNRGRLAPSTVYWMNALQGVSQKKNYFVSVNGEANIDTGKILKKIPCEHPLFSGAARAAQAELPALNRLDRGRPFFFCGAYFKYGFHEDGFTSGLDLSRVLSPEPIWA